jgi:DNA-binding SARP family transcriptional activator
MKRLLGLGHDPWIVWRLRLGCAECGIPVWVSKYHNAGMRIDVLGALQIEADRRPVKLGACVQRRLLAALVVHVDAVWGDAPPASAVKTVHSYVARLRDALAVDRVARHYRRSEAIVSAAPGYRLVARAEAVDAAARTERVRAARRAVDRDEPNEADRLLAEAFELWRGEPYGEVIDGALFAAEARRLTEIRFAGLEARLEAGWRWAATPRRLPTRRLCARRIRCMNSSGFAW